MGDGCSKALFSLRVDLCRERRNKRRRETEERTGLLRFGDDIKCM